MKNSDNKNQIIYFDNVNSDIDNDEHRENMMSFLLELFEANKNNDGNGQVSNQYVGSKLSELRTSCWSFCNDEFESSVDEAMSCFKSCITTPSKYRDRFKNHVKI